MTLLAPSRAGAQDIQKNDYALEIFQGPLLAPGRITGLSGATTATAQSLEGVYNNAAAPAVREPHSLDHFEWEPSGGISFPGAYGGTDFSNRGEKGIERQIRRNQQLGLSRPPTVETTDSFLYLNGGLWGQLGNFGITATADMLRYDVASPSDTSPSLGVTIARIHLVGAYGFLRNQLCVGGGVRMAYLGVSQSDSQSSVISMFGVAPQAGLIIKPEDRQFRVGLTARAAVSASTFTGIQNLIIQEQPDGSTVRRAGSFVLPSRVTQPWEIEAGVAYQFGPRPLNPRWIDPVDHQNELIAVVAARRQERAAEQRAEIAAMPVTTAFDQSEKVQRITAIARDEVEARQFEDAELRNREKTLHEERRARYLNWPREHILVLASVLMTGPSADAVALEGFIDQRRELVGTRATLAPRFALESEAVPNRLKTRAGIYIEPSRFTDGSPRQHFTTGVDVRVVDWSVFGLFPNNQWRVSAFVDLAERYQNFGFGIGPWH